MPLVSMHELKQKLNRQHRKELFRNLRKAQPPFLAFDNLPPSRNEDNKPVILGYKDADNFHLLIDIIINFNDYQHGESFNRRTIPLNDIRDFCGVETPEPQIIYKNMGRPKKYGESDIIRVKSYLDDGKSIRQIAELLQMSPTTVMSLKKMLPIAVNYR